jgi:hypothetical protein
MCITMESPLVLEYLDLPASARGDLCQGVVVVDVPDHLIPHEGTGQVTEKQQRRLTASSENQSTSFFSMLYSNNANYANDNKNAHPRHITATCNTTMDPGRRSSSNKKDHMLDLADDESSMGFRDQWVAATFGQLLSDVITLMQ